MTPATTDEFSTLIQGLFDSVRVRERLYFRRLWNEGKLRYAGDEFDFIDEYNARIVCQSIESSERILVVAPDRSPKRRSAMIASAALHTFDKNSRSDKEASNVVYFGTSVGIRQHLENVFVNRDSLRNYFDTSVGRNARTCDAVIGRTIPKLHCIYTPIDAQSVLAELNPEWIAIDCDDADDLPWLDSVLEVVARRSIPTIAWTSNHLSNSIQAFRKFATKVFVWPSSVITAKAQNVAHQSRWSIFDANPVADVVPCELTGDDALQYSSRLQSCEVALAKAMSLHRGRFQNDAVLLAYRILRSLERLPIPLAEYETLRGNHWNLTSFDTLRKSFKDFLSYARPGDELSNQLHHAGGAIENAFDFLSQPLSPLWDSLVDLCIEDVADTTQRRLLVFGLESHARMFADLLASQQHTPPDVLKELGITPVSFNVIYRFLSRGTTRHNDFMGGELESLRTDGLQNTKLIYVGLPTRSAFRRFSPLLEFGQHEVVCFPHQLPRLSALVGSIGRVMAPDPDSCVTALTEITGAGKSARSYRRLQSAVSMSEPRAIQGRASPSQNPTASFSWPETSLQDAIKELYDNDFDPLSLEGSQKHYASVGDDIDLPVFTREAFDITFTDNWHGVFAGDDTLNYLNRSGGHKPRAVRTLKSADRVILIYGHRQQSLFELVLSRIQHDPDIDLFMTLVRLWQEEARVKFGQWIRSGKTLEDLAREMKIKGCTVQKGTIENWCFGSTLRPNDSEDLQRLAFVLNMPKTKEHYNQIRVAAGKLQVIHRTLGRKIKQWIIGGATQSGLRDEEIDSHTKLTFGDIQDALIVLTIKRIEKVEGLFAYHRLGTLEKVEENASG